MHKIWLNLSLAFRNITRYKRRSGLSIGAVIFGVTAMMLVSGFIEWIFYNFRETTIKSHLGHLQIVRPGYHDMGKANPYAFLLPSNISNSITTIDNKLVKIKIIARRLSFSGLISHGESTLSFIGEGVSPEEQFVFGDALKISEGTHLSIDRPEHIIVGEGLAQNLGISVGDHVVLLVNTASGGINAKEVIVSGFFTTVTKNYDDNSIRIPIETAHKLLRTTGVHSWIILLSDTEHTNDVLAELRNNLPKDQYEIIPWYELADFYNKTVVLFTQQVMGIKIIIAVIILLSIFNTMNISVLERIGEIGTAMALGVKRFDIMRQFLIEGMLIGCVGGLLGLVIGLLLATIISKIGIPMPPPPGMARGYIGEILVTSNIALESLILAITTTLVASVYPAWRASRMQIVDALRRNQ